MLPWTNTSSCRLATCVETLAAPLLSGRFTGWEHSPAPDDRRASTLRLSRRPLRPKCERLDGASGSTTAVATSQLPGRRRSQQHRRNRPEPRCALQTVDGHVEELRACLSLCSSAMPGSGSGPRIQCWPASRSRSGPVSRKAGTRPFKGGGRAVAGDSSSAGIETGGLTPPWVPSSYGGGAGSVKRHDPCGRRRCVARFTTGVKRRRVGLAAAGEG